MTVEKTEIALSVTGEEATARAMQNVARSMASVQTATAKVNEAQKVQSVTAASVTAQFARLGPAVGIVSQGLGAMNGTLGKVGAVLGSTTSAIAGMTAGFGPLGIALGVVSAAFTAYNFVVKDAEARSEALATATKNATRSLTDQVRAIQESSRVRREEQELLSSEEGLAVRVAEAYRELARANQAADTAGAQRARASLASLEAQRSELNQNRLLREQAAADRRQVEEDIANAEALGLIRGERRANPSAERERQRAEMRRLGQMWDDSQRANQERAGTQLGTVDPSADNAARAQERFNKINADGLKIAQARNEERALELEQLQAVTDTYGNLASVMGGSVVSAIDAVAKGEMSLGAAFKNIVAERLKALALEEAVLALVSLAKAASLSVWNPAGAAQELTAAALHGQAAAAAGAGAGIAYAIGSGGGGGGGGGGGSAAPSSQPTRDTSAQPSGPGERVININFGSPVVTATTIAELGRDLKSFIVTAEARGWA